MNKKNGKLVPFLFNFYFIPSREKLFNSDLYYNSFKDLLPYFKITIDKDVLK